MSALLATFALLSPTVGDALHFVDASVDVNGTLDDARFRDMDGDGRTDLCLLRSERTDPSHSGGTLRVFEVFRIERDRVAARPWFEFEIPAGVVAYSIAEVAADEAGPELLLMTQRGLYAFPTGPDPFAGRMRLVDTPLLFDVADQDRLPYWSYVAPAEGGDLLLLPCAAGFGLFAPRIDGDEGETGYERRAWFGQTPEHSSRTFDDEVDEEEEGDDSFTLAFSRGSGGADWSDTWGSAVPFLPGRSTPRVLLSHSQTLDAPALLDIDGDGRCDLLQRVGEAFVLWSDVATGAQGSTTIPLPEGLADTGDGNLTLVDLDSDGDRDLLVETNNDLDGLENDTYTLSTYRFDQGTWFGREGPDQVLRIEAFELGVQLADVNGDGHMDLCLRKFLMPSLLVAVSNLEFEMTQLLFLGEGGRRPFGKSPVLSVRGVYDEQTLGEAITQPDLSQDLNGDGIADLVEVDAKGRVAVRRVRLESSFFGGDTWTLEREPWKRFEAAAALAHIELVDVNGDGWVDLASRSSDSLVLQLSIAEDAR